MVCDISYILKFDNDANIFWIKDKRILKESNGDYTISEVRDTNSYISFLQLTPRYETSAYEGIYSCVVHNSNLGHDQIFKSFITTSNANLDEHIMKAETNPSNYQYTYLILFSTIGVVSFALFCCISCFLTAKYIELVFFLVSNHF